MVRNIIGIVCLALLVGGCTSNLKPVSARVDSVRIDEQTAEGVRVLVTVVAENPNDVPLPVVRAKYEVDLAGAEPFKFTDLPAVSVPANGVQTVTLPAALAKGGGDAAGTSYRVSGGLIYEPPGEIRKLMTEYGIPLPSASFKDEGTLP